MKKTKRLVLWVIYLIILMVLTVRIFSQIFPQTFYELTVLVTKTPQPTVEQPLVTPKPDRESISIVWLADTQAMVYREYVKALKSMGTWIVDQKQAQNVQYVIQTGDAVDNGFSPRQWDTFDVLYDLLKDELPYLPVAGNHDLGVKLGDYSAYLERPYIKEYPKERSFADGKAVYDTFSVGGTDFLLIGVGWNAEEEAAQWVNNVLAAHEDYVAILVTHSYIKQDGSFAEHGEEIHDSIIKNNANVRLVLSGHARGSGARIEEFDDNGDGEPDRRVYALMYNYQNYDLKCGQLRILTFDPVKRSIQVTTYSPYTDIYYKDGYFKSVTFTLEDAF